MKAPSLRTVDRVVLLGIVGSAIGFGVATSNDDDTTPRIAARPAPTQPRTLPEPTARPSPEKEQTPVRGFDYSTAYAALRDDGNPKPRLQLIDRWAREAGPDRDRDFLTHAMVDPDEAVRTRAQELFDRDMVRPR